MTGIVASGASVMSLELDEGAVEIGDVGLAKGVSAGGPLTFIVQPDTLKSIRTEKRIRISFLIFIVNPNAIEDFPSDLTAKKNEAATWVAYWTASAVTTGELRSGPLMHQTNKSLWRKCSHEIYQIPTISIR